MVTFQISKFKNMEHQLTSMKNFFLTLLALFCLSSTWVSAQKKPNVIIIYTDDQATLDVNVLGAKDLVSPHMDQLLLSGTTFTQFYASPVCSPSRASLLTGKNPQRAGVPGNAGQDLSRKSGLPPSEYTMAEMFKDNGYSTYLIGKWHLGYQPEMRPNQQGFDYSFGHLVGCIDNYSHFYYWGGDNNYVGGPNRHDLYRNNEEIFLDGQYFPDLMVQEAKQVIEKKSEKPFFIFFSMNTPHYPYQGYAKWIQYYREKGVASPRDLYAAFLTTQDEKIGELIALLEENDLREDTIIIFQSDNGHSTETRAYHGGGYTGPYRGAKQCLFEGGIRVPASISWPGKIPANQFRDQMSVNVDWMPTLIELCDFNTDTSKMDGQSLMPIINNKKAPSNHEQGYCWEFIRRGVPTWVARKGKWKLYANPYDTSRRDYTYSEKFVLFDLENDPGESINLYDKEPQVVAELKTLYKTWKNKK
jgi:arylsulfatase A-like enzyme